MARDTFAVKSKKQLSDRMKNLEIGQVLLFSECYSPVTAHRFDEEGKMIPMLLNTKWHKKVYDPITKQITGIGKVVQLRLVRTSRDSDYTRKDSSGWEWAAIVRRHIMSREQLVFEKEILWGEIPDGRFDDTTQGQEDLSDM